MRHLQDPAVPPGRVGVFGAILRVQVVPAGRRRVRGHVCCYQVASRSVGTGETLGRQTRQSQDHD